MKGRKEVLEVDVVTELDVLVLDVELVLVELEVELVELVLDVELVLEVDVVEVVAETSPIDSQVQLAQLGLSEIKQRPPSVTLLRLLMLVSWSLLKIYKSPPIVNSFPLRPVRFERPSIPVKVKSPPTWLRVDSEFRVVTRTLLSKIKSSTTSCNL